MDEFQLFAYRTRPLKSVTTGCETGVQRCLSYYETENNAVDRVMSSLDLGWGTLLADTDTMLLGQ